MPNLLLLFLIPAVSALVVLMLTHVSARALKSLAVSLSLIPLGLLISFHHQWIGADFNSLWFSSLDVHFHFHVDALSLIFLYIVAVIVPISLLVADAATLSSPNQFFAWVLLLQTLLIGFFTAQDLVVFTVFWEAMLLPLFFLMSGWGGPHRQSAAFQFILYMIAGSVLMVLAVLAVYFVSAQQGTPTFDIPTLTRIMASQSVPVWVGAIFLLAFAVKTPLFPFHGWLPNAYAEASVTGTILLSAVLSKAGIYGMLRIGHQLFPTLMQQWSFGLIVLAITGVLYGALAAWGQRDYKRLIAYSSFSHVNFILVGVFLWTQTAHSGALLQTINHAVTITALFIVAYWLEQRIGSTSMDPISGAASWLPHLCWLTLFFVLASVALPGTSNFVGELLIFFGLFGYNPWMTALLGLTMILSVVYMLRWMQKTYFMPAHPPEVLRSDIGLPEWLIAVPLIFLILWIGIYPKPVLEQIAHTESEVTWQHH